MRSSLVALLVFALLADRAVGGPDATSAAAPATVERSLIGHNSFWIPLVPEGPLRAPLQVVLLLSSDQGKTWTPYQELVLPARKADDPDRPAPIEQGFSVRELADGEYWLLSRTAEQLAAGMPGPGTRPEKIVVVDTSPPAGRLEVNATAEGLVGRLTVADPHLQPESLRVEYQDDRGQWIPLVISTESLAGPDGSLAARTAPIPPPTHGPRPVRLAVRDRAGNTTTLDKSAVPAPPPADDPATPPAAAGPVSGPPPMEPWSPLPPLDWEPSGAPAVPPEGQTPAPEGAAASEPPPPWHNTSSSVPGAPSASPATGPFPPTAAPPYPTDPAPSPDLPSPDPPASPTPPTPSAQPARPIGSTPAAPPTRPAAQPGALPEPDRTWAVAEREFQLEYDLEFVGPEGLMRIDLYATADGGRSWQRRDDDPDRQSPVTVRVDREGLYGFRLHPVSRQGYAAPPPQPGDQPDVWILVDQTRPEAEITSVRLDPGSAGQDAALLIGWTASDLWLTPEPVTLEFSAQPSGPWSTIAAGIPNRGLYRWAVDETLPRQVYLRLIVQDRAGNRTEYPLPHPVSTSQSGPTARILRVIGGQRP